MNNPQPSQSSAQPPTLIDLLTNINRQLNTLTQKLSSVEKTTLELQTTLAKRRMVRTPSTPPTTATLMPSIVTTLERFWEANRMPMPLHYLARLYTRQIAGSGMKFLDLIMPANDRELKIISTALGNCHIVLMSVWNAAPSEKRLQWKGASTKSLLKEREIFREQLNDVDGEMRSDGTISLRPEAQERLTGASSSATSAHEGTSA